MTFYRFLSTETGRKSQFLNIKQKKCENLIFLGEKGRNILYIAIMGLMRHRMLKKSPGDLMSPRTDTQNNKGNQPVPYYNRIQG